MSKKITDSEKPRVKKFSEKLQKRLGHFESYKESCHHPAGLPHQGHRVWPQCPLRRLTTVYNSIQTSMAIITENDVQAVPMVYDSCSYRYYSYGQQEKWKGNARLVEGSH